LLNSSNILLAEIGGNPQTQEHKNNKIPLAIRERQGDKESPKDCSRLKSCESLHTCLCVPFSREMKDEGTFYIPRLPSNLENILSMNMYMNVFYIP
jgi:hypothetical protein